MTYLISKYWGDHNRCNDVSQSYSLKDYDLKRVKYFEGSNFRL